MVFFAAIILVLTLGLSISCAKGCTFNSVSDGDNE